MVSRATSAKNFVSELCPIIIEKYLNIDLKLCFYKKKEEKCQ